MTAETRASPYTAASAEHILDEVELVIFDFDGVIADSEVISLTTLQAALRQIGIDLSMEVTRQKFLGTSLEKIVSYVRSHGTRDDAEFSASWQSALFERFCSDLKPMPNVTSVLDLLDKSDVGFCIASSSTLERIDVSLEVMGLDHTFSHVFSAEQVARGKPAPDLFLYAAREMGASPASCLVIEDSPFGAQAARHAKMRCAGFVGGSHLASIKSEHGHLLSENGAQVILSSHQELASQILANRACA